MPTLTTLCIMGKLECNYFSIDKSREMGVNRPFLQLYIVEGVKSEVQYGFYSIGPRTIWYHYKESVTTYF